MLHIDFSKINWRALRKKCVPPLGELIGMMMGAAFAIALFVTLTYGQVPNAINEPASVRVERPEAVRIIDTNATTTTIILVLITSVVAPSILAFWNGRRRRSEQVEAAKIRHAEKVADWARQDEVARRAEEAAAKVQQVALRAEETAVKVQETADRLEVSNKHVADVADITGHQIDEIHHMVNGQMTAMMQNALDTKILLVFKIRENAELKRTDRDITLTEATLAEITKTEQQIKDLMTAIEERKKLAAEIVNKVAALS
jgi:hypothetical protein